MTLQTRIYLHCISCSHNFPFVYKSCNSSVKSRVDMFLYCYVLSNQIAFSPSSTLLDDDDDDKNNNDNNEDDTNNNSTYLYIYLLTYLLTPLNRVLLEKLTDFQLVKKFPTFYGNRNFITSLTVPAVCPCPEPDQSSPCHYTTS